MMRLKFVTFGSMKIFSKTSARWPPSDFHRSIYISTVRGADRGAMPTLVLERIDDNDVSRPISDFVFGR